MRSGRPFAKYEHIVAFITVVAIGAIACGGGEKNDTGDAGGEAGTSGQTGIAGIGGASGHGDKGAAGSIDGSGGTGGTGGTGGSGGMGGTGGSGGTVGGMAGSAAADAGTDAGGGAGSGIIDGSLDPTFGVDRIALSDLEEATDFAGVEIQPSGKIVVVGVIGNDAAIARYTREGALDPSFGDTGLALVEFGNNYSHFSKVDQQSDGSLIAIGLWRKSDATRDMLVARFSAEGQLDRSFGTDGFTVIDTGDEDAAAELIVLPDDTLLIGGYATPAATGEDFAVVRLDADGIPDPSFGSAGLAFAHPDQSDRALAMGRDSQGRIVLGGCVSPDSDSDEVRVGFARFTATGVLDGSFGNNGWTVVPKAGATDDSVEDLIVLGGDEILATGSLDGELGLIRLTSTGEVDVGFGVSGQAHAGVSGRGRALIREAGSTLVVGYSGTLAAVAKFNDAGDLDPSFAGDGFRTCDLGTGDSDRFDDVACQEDGRLVAVGWAEGETTDGVLVRLDIR